MMPQLTVRNVWTDTVSVAMTQPSHSNVRYVAPNQAATAAPQPTPEEDADRWVKQVLFDCYND